MYPNPFCYMWFQYNEIWQIRFLHYFKFGDFGDSNLIFAYLCSSNFFSVRFLLPLHLFKLWKRDSLLIISGKSLYFSENNKSREKSKWNSQRDKIPLNFVQQMEKLRFIFVLKQQCMLYQICQRETERKV